ncbi:uncharacterized protein SCHCODRAFT_02701559 [Schizophyllum commune H4-8]|nr:uncharacterized protein SCHCODRAFT_02701559 [Schizophyllum commune H4-8]KAI5892667.1 hypothetical protein SCHCODRAFT_02701559 [Schizophyllum commune H4-8]
MACHQQLDEIQTELHSQALDNYHKHAIVYLPALNSAGWPELPVHWGIADDADILCTIESREAILAFPGRILPGTGARFSPDGKWNGGGPNNNLFEDISIAFYIAPALLFHGTFQIDSLRAARHLYAIKSMIIDDESPTAYSWDVLPITHRLLEKKLSFEPGSPLPPLQRRAFEERPSTLIEHPLPSCFTNEGWPTTTDAARQELTRLTPTHQVRPLPVYDEHNNLLDPSYYETVLPGALVNVLFKLRHQRDKRGHHYFLHQLEEILIIRRGPVTHSVQRSGKGVPLSARFPLPRPTRALLNGEDDHKACSDNGSDGGDSDATMSDNDAEFPSSIVPLFATRN